MQINLSSFIEQSLTTEQRIGSELLKSLGLDGYAMDGLSLQDIFGAPGNGAVYSSAARDIEQIRGWNHTAILAKSLQFSLGSVGVFCPLWTAEAISAHHGEEYAAANRFTGMEQYGVPESWVQSPRQHRIANLLKRPNPWCDEAQMLFQMAQQVEAHGVCYFLVLPNQAGLPSQMWIIPKVNIQPLSPTIRFPEGSYRVGNLSRISLAISTSDREPESHQEALSRLSNKEYSAKWVIPVGLPSIVYCDDFLNSSSAIADALDTDTVIHQSRRKSLSKQMTNGPQLELLPGTDLQASERDKLLETFESQNQGPDNQGRPWITPRGVKVNETGHSAREMEYTNSANQSRDHVMGHRLVPTKMYGMSEGGAYAEIIGIIKNNNRNVLQPMMRILSGQLTIGLQRYFEDSQTEFMALIQAGSIDDPEQKMREWNLLISAGAVTKGQLLKAFNMAPFGDERDDEIAGIPPAQPGGGMFGAAEPGEMAGLMQPKQVPEKGINGGDVGPDTPGVGAAVPPEGKETEKAVQNVFGGLTRQQFIRNRKAVMDTLQQFENKQIREKTAIATLKTLGLSSEQAMEFVESVKDDIPDASPAVLQENAQTAIPAVAEALFSRMHAQTAIDIAASMAQTSGVGDLRMPTPEELQLGSYRKGRFRIAGLAIAIENPARSKRSGIDESGRPWSVEMNSHYGYIIGSTGYDKDQVDCCFPEFTETTFDGMVFVINQANADGTFDEHKVMFGCDSKRAAIGEYLSNYHDGWKSRIMSVVPLSMDGFKQWLFDDLNGPIAGELMQSDAIRFMPTVSEKTPVSTTTKSENYADRLQKLHDRRGEDLQGIAKTESAQEAERANLIADILFGAFGEDTERMLSDDNDFGMLTKMFSKVWDESKYSRHPRGARFGGRFAPKNSVEAVTAVHSAIDSALNGQRSGESASELVDLLSNLTLNELRAVKAKYAMSASGRTKKDLVAKIAARLDSGRRQEQPAPAPVIETPPQTEPERLPPTAEEEGRLFRLRERLPRGMLIMEDDDGTGLLVIGNQQHPLPGLIVDQLPELERLLRANGHDPDAIMAETELTPPTPEVTAAQRSSLNMIPVDESWMITAEPGRGRVIVSSGNELHVIQANGDVATAIPRFEARLREVIDQGGAESMPTPVPAPSPAASQTTPIAAPSPLSEKQQLDGIGAAFLDKIKPGPDGNLIQPRVSKAKVIVEETATVPRAWNELNVDHRREIEEAWRTETKKNIRENEYLKARWQNEAKAEAQAQVNAMSDSDIAAQIHERIKTVEGFQGATVDDVATMLRTGESTASSLASQHKSEVMENAVAERLDGRKAWMRNKYATEIAAYEASQVTEGWYEYAKNNGHMEIYKNKDVMKELDRMGLTLQDLPSMIGVPDNMSVKVSHVSWENGINLRTSGKIRLDRTIHTDSEGRLVVHNNSCFIDDDAPKGTGLEVLSNAVGYAKSKGVYKFYTNPCRSSSMNGYAVWPQFGYDAPISQISESGVKSLVRSTYPNANTIRDIYDTPGGQAWWWKNGHSIGKAEFYMADGSRNMNAMQSYMAGKKAARAKVKKTAKNNRTTSG